MRKVFLDDFPKQKHGQKENIIWTESINYIAPFQYNDIKGEVKIVDYDGKFLYIQYLDYDIYKMGTNEFKLCRFKELLKLKTNDFKVEIGTTFKDDKRDITITDRKYIEKERTYKNRENTSTENNKYYRYKCNRCGFDGGEHYKSGKYVEELWIKEGNLLTNGNGCPCCSNPPQISVPHINSIVANPETHWMIKYFQGGYNEAKRYTPRSSQSVKPVCPDCGRIKIKNMKISDIYRNHSMCCSCSDGQSYPNKFMYDILEQLNIEFETEYSPKWCKYQYNNKISKGRYDFYFEFNDKKYIVEMDGGWHINDNKISGQTSKESKDIDDYKDKLAEEHGIKVIRIKSEISEIEFIKDKVLNSKLNKLFDLSIIDWLKCEEFALSNLCKKICEIKQNNPDLTTSEIIKIVGINSRTTIIKYLKKGAELGWCNYNAKEESIKSGNKENDNGKIVEIFKEGISLGVFPSCAELERKSEDLFGIKLNKSKISSVASPNCKDKTHKGFTFKYV